MITLMLLFTKVAFHDSDISNIHGLLYTSRKYSRIIQHVQSLSKCNDTKTHLR
jgi:hypothetical protein